MNIYNGDVGQLLLISFVLGGAIGVFYDIILSVCEAVKINPPKKFKRVYSVSLHIALFFRDFFFCVFFSFCALILLYNANSGVFRASVYFCMLAGYFLYRKILSRGIRKLMSSVLVVPMWIAGKILHILSVPIRLIFKLLDLTIGRFICIIICRMKNKRLESKRKREEKIKALSHIPTVESGKEEYVDIKKAEVRASRVVIRRKDA